MIPRLTKQLVVGGPEVAKRGPRVCGAARGHGSLALPSLDVSEDDAWRDANERAWRLVDPVDDAHRRGELDDAGWHDAMASILVPAYLAAETAEGGSGHSGTPEDWEYSRGIVAEAVAGETFLDVGCANGLLMESVHRWTGLEPYGLDISPELGDLARERYPQWAARIWVGNALGWEPPRRFDTVRTGLEYVPEPRRRDLVAYLLGRVVAAGGRLVIGKFNEEVERRSLEEEVSGWGFRVAGRAEGAHRSEPRLAYRVFWIERAAYRRS